ncbi:centromere protein S-like isoform X2 [Schistocerca serialis cubense]|uniref:centromere protein S-like isoform X2 n=1 Tax=Schistocerca serialis cubense TaxID=2023355 RepID=UPI00214EC466|nr:centromere protein S-like isoform X2 [Schistocerca serialis cubense]
MSAGMCALKKEEILKIILFQEVDRVVTETSKEIGVTCSSEVVNVFAEMAWKKARSIAEDLELFAKHAKRSTVSSDDVKLVVRRNPSLSQQEPPSRDIRRLFIYLQQ